ncbi:MAG: hypothetical protein HEQ22_00820 [Sphingopyxis sp.]
MIAFMLLPLCSCGTEKVVTAWPGMPVSEFNRVNADSAAPMRSDASDWIGINAPVTLLFTRGHDRVRFATTSRGGGIQVMSSGLTSTGEFGTVRVRTISFNIGDGMVEQGRQPPTLAQQCRQLARMASVKSKAIPQLKAIRDRFAAARGSLRDIETCTGRSTDFSFAITATHYVGHYRHGGDFSYAFLNGYLGSES